MRTRRRGSQTVTIRDVAEQAHVSAMTVSNVLNGRGGMSETTRQAVLQAIEKLGYQPNQAARSLARAHSLRIGFIQPNLHNAFLSAVMVGASQSCSLAGSQLMLRSTQNHTMPALSDTVVGLISNGASGILMTPPFAEMFERSEMLAEIGIPVAAVAPGRPLENILTARVDDRAAAAAMVDRLIALGHRRIAFVAGPEAHSSAQARAEGYRDALRTHGIAIDPYLIVTGTYGFDSSLAPIRPLLAAADPPSAIFASNDNMAAAAIVVANQLGLAVPTMLAVAGFDDTEVASLVWPALTTIRQPIEEMARECMTMLIGRIEGRIVADDRVFPYELIERGSTAPGQD